jgi:predicted acyl esterase
LLRTPDTPTVSTIGSEVLEHVVDEQDLTEISDALKRARAFVEHPAYDTFWQERAVPRQLTHTSVPTLTVGGTWDQEDLYGPHGDVPST